MDSTNEDKASVLAGAEAPGSKDQPGDAEADLARALDTPTARLAKLAGAHALTWLVALSLFAAADSWSAVTGLGIAALLAIVTGALAGVVTANLVHEWFHYFGARYVGASFEVPSRLGLFLYDWDFSSNNRRQFLIMSVAGSVGGVVAVSLLWQAVPTDSWGRAALQSGAIASVIFAALIEWPVIRRVRRGSDPFTELATIPQGLKRNFTIALLSAILMTIVLAP
ncbi:MAG: hypothetical protein HRT77_03070 [Halioglobus sp.]|nr:hypothetical protein [Halioglobus sp.]